MILIDIHRWSWEREWLCVRISITKAHPLFVLFVIVFVKVEGLEMLQRLELHALLHWTDPNLL